VKEDSILIKEIIEIMGKGKARGKQLNLNFDLSLGIINQPEVEKKNNKKKKSKK
jgi:hypothetical protein